MQTAQSCTKINVYILYVHLCACTSPSLAGSIVKAPSLTHRHTYASIYYFYTLYLNRASSGNLLVRPHIKYATEYAVERCSKNAATTTRTMAK